MFRLWRHVSWLIRAAVVPAVLLTATPGRSPAQSTAPTRAIRYPVPPQLLFPADRSSITLPTPVFQWTPVTGVDNASYRFRLVAIIGNQTPREALESDRPVLEANLYQQTTLLYSAAAYPLPERAVLCLAGAGDHGAGERHRDDRGPRRQQRGPEPDLHLLLSTAGVGGPHARNSTEPARVGGAR